MIIRVLDKGFDSVDFYRYLVQKRVFGFWRVIFATDFEKAAIEKFNEINPPKVLLRKEV